jgi:hypothetical protein
MAVIVHARSGQVFLQRQRHVLQVALLFEQGDHLRQFGWSDQGRRHDAITQLGGRQRLPHPFLERRRGISLIAQQPLVQIVVEPTVLLEYRQRDQGIVQLLVANAKPLIVGQLVQHPLVDQLPQHLLFDARSLQQGRIGVTAQHGLHALALLLVGPLKFLQRDLAATDHGGIRGSTGFEILIDAPQSERDGQQSDDGVGEPALGVIADFL